MSNIKVPKREGGYATISTDAYNSFQATALAEVVDALTAEDYEPALPMSVSAAVEHRITIVSSETEDRSDIDVAIEFTFVFSGITNPVDADNKPISLSSSVVIPTTSDDRGTTSLQQGVAIQQTNQNLFFAKNTSTGQTMSFYPLVLNGDIDTITAAVTTSISHITTSIVKQSDKSWLLSITPDGSQTPTTAAGTDFIIEFTAFGQTIQKKVNAVFSST